MNADRIDRAKLAALVDGRLKGAERDAALASLAASPEDLEVVADTIAVADELEEPLDIRDAARARDRRRFIPVKWLAAAAAILMAVVLPRTIQQGRSGPEFGPMLTGRTALAPGWEQHSWSATRGSADGLTERARAVRAGALTTAMDVAATRGGDSATSRLASQVAVLLADVPGASTVVATYRDIAAHSAGVTPDRLRQARHDARDKVSPGAFDDGAWLEAARIAATDQDTTFFANRASRDQLGRLERETAGDTRTHDDVLSVGRLIEARDWSALENTTTNVLAILAGP